MVSSDINQTENLTHQSYKSNTNVANTWLNLFVLSKFTLSSLTLFSLVNHLLLASPSSEVSFHPRFHLMTISFSFWSTRSCVKTSSTIRNQKMLLSAKKSFHIYTRIHVFILSSITIFQGFYFYLRRNSLAFPVFVIFLFLKNNFHLMYHDLFCGY